MISCAVHPASAIRRPSVLRNPWGWQPSGRPAAVIASPHETAEAVHREGLAVLGVDDGHVLAWRRLEGVPQVFGNRHLDRNAGLVARIGGVVSTWCHVSRWVSRARCPC